MVCSPVHDGLRGGGGEEGAVPEDASGNVRDKDIWADFMAIGVWERQRVVFFDNHILDDYWFWMPTHLLVSTATQAMQLPCVPQ